MHDLDYCFAQPGKKKVIVLRIKSKINDRQQLKCFAFSLEKTDKLSYILFHFWIPGMNYVVNMRSHKGLDLHILVLDKYLPHNLQVTCLWLFHQDKICSKSLLNSTFGIKGHSLNVRTGLNIKKKREIGVKLDNSLHKAHI